MSSIKSAVSSACHFLVDEDNYFFNELEFTAFQLSVNLDACIKLSNGGSTRHVFKLNEEQKHHLLFLARIRIAAYMKRHTKEQLECILAYKDFLRFSIYVHTEESRRKVALIVADISGEFLDKDVWWFY